MKNSKLFYRAEIDGLRAVAVISVILYHAQVILFEKNWFEGGYIGVDIFFVISGYLITRIILSELQDQGSFSFLNFYERRARRILPMLFVVIFVSIPFAWQKLLPSDFVEYAESILASLVFGSNFFFYFSTTEYGADSALLKPFLHTWSLGVEEQFYLVFPIFSIIAFKFFRKHFLTILVALSLLSLQFAELMVDRNSDLNFYLPFSRFWELAVGSVLAYREINHKVEKMGFFNRVLPIVGLYLVFYSILFFDKKTPHPSFHTIVPVLGVALIIGFASKDELVGKILAFKPFVWLGLISYSAYLWHFPIFAFARLGVESHTNYDKFGWIALTLVLSVISYRLIERTYRRQVSRQFLRQSVLISSFFLILGSIYVIQGEGITTKSRFGFDPNIISSIEPVYLFGDDGCQGAESVVHKKSEFCLLGDTKKTNLDFLLIGDSHAMHAQPLLDKISRQLGLKGVFGGISGCPPLLGVYPMRGSPHPSELSKRCFGFNQNGFDLVRTSGIKKVFLIARWDYYVDGSDVGDLNNISDASLKFGDIEETREVYNSAVENTYAAYEKLGVKVVVLLQVPHQKINVKRLFESFLNEPSLSARKIRIELAINDGVSRSDHLFRQSIASSSWLELPSEDANLVVIDPTDEFCSDIICPIMDETSAFYTDYDHASEFGFSRLENKIRSIIDK